ncbi:hypothetical protein HAX54_019367, partial [Datura stramonium]|nr:hypothetical protein [Datura stramonium]
SRKAPYESRALIVHQEADSTLSPSSFQIQKISSSIPFKLSDFAAWNAFKTQFSTSSNVPFFGSHFQIS